MYAPGHSFHSNVSLPRLFTHWEGFCSPRHPLRRYETTGRERKRRRRKRKKERRKKRETRITHTRASPPDENPPPALISLSLISTECDDDDGFPRVIHVPSTFLPSTSRQTAKIAPASGMQRWGATLGHRGEGIRINVSKIHFEI